MLSSNWQTSYRSWGSRFHLLRGKFEFCFIRIQGSLNKIPGFGVDEQLDPFRCCCNLSCHFLGGGHFFPRKKTHRQKHDEGLRVSDEN